MEISEFNKWWINFKVNVRTFCWLLLYGTEETIQKLEARRKQLQFRIEQMERRN